MLEAITEVCLDLFFPPVCAGCQRLGTYLCPKCYAQLEFYPLDWQPALENCYLDRVVACAHYAPPLNRLLRTYKYQGSYVLAEVLANLIWFSTDIPRADLITFIPLHPKKLRQRGFNQTQLLAEKLARKVKLPCHNTLDKTIHHRSQAETCDRRQRLTNLDNTFTLNQEFLDWLSQQVRPPHTVLVIDDVITTGTTLNEAAKILKTAGVVSVIGLTLAHD